MSKRIQVGVVGTSWWAEIMHLPALKSHSQADVVALCGRNHDRAEEVAGKNDIPEVFTDYQEMIDRGNLDALIVSIPDDLHHRVTLAALDAGLHVLCEKPLALTEAQAREMNERAEAAKVRHMTMFTYRFLPQYRHMKRLLEEGFLGRPYHLDISYFSGYARGGDYAWRFDGRRANGILGDLGSHMIDLARWFFGDIARVSAHLTNHVARSSAVGSSVEPANDSACLLLEFENGAQGTIHVSAVAHIGSRGQEQRITLAGENGALESAASFERMELRGAKQDEEFRTLPAPEALMEGVDPHAPVMEQYIQVFTRQSAGPRAFVDAILEDRPAVPSFREGWKVQEVIEAANRSHRTGSWISLG